MLAIHRRPLITSISLERFKRQRGIDLDIVVAGDSEIEQDIAELAGAYYVEHENLPLAAKYQAAVARARELNPDYIVTLGSDSWISDDWCRIGIEEMASNGWDAVGKNAFAVLNLDTWEIIERAYMPPRLSIPDGNGRMVSAKGMEKLGWVLYPDYQGLDGIDSASHRHCVKEGLSTGIMNRRTEVKVMEIKSSRWQSVNGFEALKTAPSLRKLTRIRDPEIWMYVFFPGGWDTLRRAFG